MDMTDEEVTEKTKTKPHSVTPSQSAAPTASNREPSPCLDEGSRDPSQSAAPTVSNREPSPCLEPVWKAPTIVLDKLKEWLNSNFIEYQEAKMKVQEYDEIFDFWKLIGGEDE